jgi:hypothetical protein
MLRDIPVYWRPPYDGFTLALREFHTGNRNTQPLRVYRGIYLAHINFDKEIAGLIVDRWPEFDVPDGEHDMTWFSSFGVVDHWTQLPLDLLERDKRGLLVFLGHHAKAEQHDDGGWRWHKWGPYIGVFQEQAAANEYLYDTPDVIEVWSYQIVEVRGEL